MSSIIVWLGIYLFFWEGRRVGQFIVWGMKFVSRLQVARDFLVGNNLCDNFFFNTKKQDLDSRKHLVFFFSSFLLCSNFFLGN